MNSKKNQWTKSSSKNKEPENLGEVAKTLERDYINRITQ
jgi:hypothetical protein